MIKKTGRKPKPEDEKVRQKKVYITDKQEKQILRKTKKKDLTEVVLQFTHI